MTRPIITIHNITTDEIVNREMTDTEFAQYEADQAAQVEADAAKAAAQAKLAALGLTTDDLKALGL